MIYRAKLQIQIASLFAYITTSEHIKNQFKYMLKLALFYILTKSFKYYVY